MAMAMVMVTNELDLFDRLRFSDFPHEIAGQENICKYTLFRWLIGHAVLDGCSFLKTGNGKGVLSRKVSGGMQRVAVSVVYGGLQLSDFNDCKQTLIKTNR